MDNVTSSNSDLAWKAEWTKFYKEVLGLDVDLSSLVVPEQKTGFERVLIAKGLELFQVLSRCRCAFVVETHENRLDMQLCNQRANSGYVIFTPSRSTDTAGKIIDFDSLALTESLVFELWYFWKMAMVGRPKSDFKWRTLCSRLPFPGDFMPLGAGVLIPMTYYKSLVVCNGKSLSISFC